MRRFYLLLLTVVPLLVHAQDLTGVWQGHFQASDGMHSSLYAFGDRYRFEVQIAQQDKKFDAVTYSYLSNVFYGKAAAGGTVNPKTGKVLLQEGKLIEVRDDIPGGVCTMTLFLQYSKTDDEEFLEGKYVSMNIKDSSNCGHGTVFLRKVATSDFYEEPFLIKRKKELEKEELAKEKPAVKAPAIIHHPDSGATAATRRPVTRPIHHPPAANRTAPVAPPPMARATIPGRSATKP